MYMLMVEAIKTKIEGKTVWRRELGNQFKKILSVQWDKLNLRVYIRDNCTDLEVDNLNNEPIEVTFTVTGLRL